MFDKARQTPGYHLSVHDEHSTDIRQGQHCRQRPFPHRRNHPTRNTRQACYSPGRRLRASKTAGGEHSSVIQENSHSGQLMPQNHDLFPFSSSFSAICSLTNKGCHRSNNIEGLTHVEKKCTCHVLHARRLHRLAMLWSEPNSSSRSSKHELASVINLASRIYSNSMSIVSNTLMCS